MIEMLYIDYVHKLLAVKLPLTFVFMKYDRNVTQLFSALKEILHRKQ